MSAAWWSRSTCSIRAACAPFVSDDGSIFYELKADNLSGLEQQIMVPAREIIHDRFNCVFHPLVGHLAALCLRARRR